MFSRLLAIVASAIFFVKSLLTRAFRFTFTTENIVLLPKAPGPVQWPVFGSLHLLGKHESPFQAFTELASHYGDIFSIKLGSTPCVVVNNLSLIKEVLNQNGKFFGGRPDFLRFHALFAGDRNNSLALCDWSNLQQRRRNLARRYCGPKQHTQNYATLGEIAAFEADEMNAILRKQASGEPIQLKKHLMRTAMNMFTHYMCSKRFDAETDADFLDIVETFDEIFWEINQGYAVDFLPWLAPFYENHMQKLTNWSKKIRSFILSRIVDEREADLDSDVPEKDFLDGLLRVLQVDPTVDRDTIIFMLEDFLGGHSSVGNLVMLALAAVIRDPSIGKKIREEIETVTSGKTVRLEDKDKLPFTEATLLECLRYSSSPIVPHVATENVNVAGYGVEAGTVVFINNYELNTSDKYWHEPEKFDPTRFLESRKYKSRMSRCDDDSGMESESEKPDLPKQEKLRKNIPQFLPFSIGKRTCIGQTLVKNTSFVMFANILREFDISCDDLSTLNQKPACMALPPETFALRLKKRFV